MAAVDRLAPGDPAPPFSLPGIDGRDHSLADHEGKPVVVVFSCCHCPYVMAWEERLNDVARDVHGRAGFVAVNANHHVGDSFEDMRARAEEKRFAFPFVRDDTQEVAAAYGAGRTPEVFVFDGEHRLVYHGAPDSDYSDPNRAEPYLRQALEAALAGRLPAVAETPPVGCTIKWRAA